MNHPVALTSDIKLNQPAKKRVPILLVKTLRELVAVVAWIYALVKLLIFDIDVALFTRFLPDYRWLLDYKLFFLLGAVTVFLIFSKTKVAVQWFSYILFYPLVVFGWRIPDFIFKQQSWILAFAVINAVISFFNSLKYNFIAVAFLMISTAIVFTSSNPYLLWPSVVVNFLLLLVVYVHRFILVFKPSAIFRMHIKLFAGIRTRGVSFFGVDENMRNLPVSQLSDKQLEKWTTNLQQSVLFNRVCLFTAKKLRLYQNSGLNVVAYVLTILLLIAFTIFSFAVINYGLDKIDPNLFRTADRVGFFNFFYYSFNTLIFNTIEEITPIKSVSQSVNMIEAFFALFLIVILVALIFSVRSRRHADELNDVIKGIEQEGSAMEKFIWEEYRIRTIDEAIAELEKLKAGMVSFIYKITESLR